MQPATLEAMRDQVRAIYRALTGNDMAEPEATPSEPEVSVDEVARRFASLETMARSIPTVTQRVPPFSFTPPLDAIEDRTGLTIELAVPSVDAEDVVVERTGELVAISGVRRGQREFDGRSYFHAEIPRGPFHRVVRLPFANASEPRVETDRGLIRIRFEKTEWASGNA